MANLDFDATGVSLPSFEPIAPGWYAATISSCDLIPSKSEGAGMMLALQFEIDGNAHPEQAGRKVTTNLCINHDQVKTQQIARSNFALIALCVDVPKVKDTTDLLGQQLRIRIKVRPEANGYPASNDVNGYKPLVGELAKDGAVTKAAEAAPAGKPAATTAAKKAGWKK